MGTLKNWKSIPEKTREEILAEVRSNKSLTAKAISEEHGIKPQGLGNAVASIRRKQGLLPPRKKRSTKASVRKENREGVSPRDEQRQDDESQASETIETLMLKNELLLQRLSDAEAERKRLVAKNNSMALLLQEK